MISRARNWIGAALCLSLAIATAPAQAQQKVELRVPSVPLITWLPFFMAVDTGVLEKHGIGVTLTKFPNIADLPGTVGKQFDLVPTTAPDFLNAVAAGLNLAAVAGETVETSHNKSFQVLVRPDSDIKGPQDLAGKRIAGPGTGSVMHVALLYWVKLNGGTPDGIVGVQVPFPNMKDQLKAGRVDAVESLEPFVGPMLAEGYKSIGDPLLAVADPVLFPFWIADADWARKNRDVLKRFTASLEGGLAEMRKDDKKAREVLAKYSGLPEPVVAKIPLPEYDFGITPAAIDVWRKVMISQGRPLQDLDVSKLVVTGQ
jgi:NitT/TauT family transport system substrate-binding protein